MPVEMAGKATVLQPSSEATSSERRWHAARRSTSPCAPSCQTGPTVWDHMSCVKIAAGRCLGVARLTAAQPATLLEDPGPSCAMNRTVDAAAAEQRRVRGIDDRIDALVSDVALAEGYSFSSAHRTTVSQERCAARCSRARVGPSSARASARGARLSWVRLAPVAQWIEQWFPKPRAHVRFMPGASIDKGFSLIAPPLAFPQPPPPP
jgi:hypothetical protein